MKPRRPAGQADRIRDRASWRGLITLARQTIEAPTPEGLSALARSAAKARDAWAPVADYPRGLVCNVMWSLCLSITRQDDEAKRERLAPMALAAVGMVEELLRQSEPAAVAKNPVRMRGPIA
jgi:hypothetical protein